MAGFGPLQALRLMTVAAMAVAAMAMAAMAMGGDGGNDGDGGGRRQDNGHGAREDFNFDQDYPPFFRQGRTMRLPTRVGAAHGINFASSGGDGECRQQIDLAAGWDVGAPARHQPTEPFSPSGHASEEAP